MLFLFGFLQFGNPILLRAAQYNRDAVITLLLDAGADINATNIDDFTALMWASLHGAEAAARVLLEAGADANYSDEKGISALKLAVGNKHDSIAHLIKAANEQEIGEKLFEVEDHNQYDVVFENDDLGLILD